MCMVRKVRNTLLQTFLLLRKTDDLTFTVTLTASFPQPLIVGEDASCIADITTEYAFLRGLLSTCFTLITRGQPTAGTHRQHRFDAHVLGGFVRGRGNPLA